MFKLSVAIVSALIVGALSVFLSDVVQEFHFTQVENTCDEFDFEYELDNGNTFHGDRFRLNGPGIVLMLGGNDVVYWTRIESWDNKSFTKGVRIVERGNDTVYFMDDYIKYSLQETLESLQSAAYLTAWDFDNVCFRNSKNGNQTFEYEVKSENNSRKANGTTYRQVDDPLIQRIHFVDGFQFEAVYEFEFTKEELNSATSFCRNYTTVISVKASLGIEQGTVSITPSLLKSLIG